MAEPYTLSDFLRNTGKRVSRIASAVPHELAASYEDAGDAIRRGTALTPLGLAPHLLRQHLQAKALQEHRAKYGDQPTIGPAPFAQHSSDPAVILTSAALDPLNLVGGGAATKLARSARAVSETVANTGKSLAKAVRELPNEKVPKSVVEMGASKASREASAARSAAEAAERDAPVREAPRTSEERAAVAPDKYRQMYRAEGEQAVVDAAKRGEHIRRSPTGSGYIGAPRHITDQAGIDEMRRSLDKQFADAKEAIDYAEVPQRRRNWYERARAGIVETTEPYAIPRTIENTATHSAGVAPVSENIFALRHGQSRALGKPQRGFYRTQEEALDSAVQEARAARLRFKIDEYKNKHDPEYDHESPFGTNDFRTAQEHGYTLPSGEPWDRGVTDQMHPFLDAERALAVDRARQIDPSITGEEAQAYPWVLGKAEDLYLLPETKARKAAEKAGKEYIPKEVRPDDPVEIAKKVEALREANKTTADFQLPKHSMSMTYETVPGEATGHRPDILREPFDVQRKYGNVWTRSPTGADPHSRDIIYSAMGLRQLPPVEGAGSWKGKQQPLTIAQPLAYPKKETVMGLTPEQLHSFKAAELLRGVMGGQTAVAGNLPVTLAGRSGKNTMLVERLGMNKVGNPESRLPSVDEMKALAEAAKLRGYDVSATGRGAILIPGKGTNARTAMKGLREGGASELEAALPGSTAKEAAMEGFYIPAVPPKAQMGKGIATSRLLRQMAKAPSEVALNISESDEFRNAAKKLHAADAEAQAQGLEVSDALQKTRRFIAEEDWPKVVELVRKGWKVPAAMAALGYSLTGMAAEEEVAR